MEFEKYMNPPVLTNILEQIEQEARNKKRYRDAIAQYDKVKKELSVDLYFGKAGYAVYSFDGQQFIVRKENVVEMNKEIEDFSNREDQRVCKILRNNFEWVAIYFNETEKK